MDMIVEALNRILTVVDILALIHLGVMRQIGHLDVASRRAEQDSVQLSTQRHAAAGAAT